MAAWAGAEPGPRGAERGRSPGTKLPGLRRRGRGREPSGSGSAGGGAGPGSGPARPPPPGESEPRGARALVHFPEGRQGAPARSRAPSLFGLLLRSPTKGQARGGGGGPGRG